MWKPMAPKKERKVQQRGKTRGCKVKGALVMGNLVTEQFANGRVCDGTQTSYNEQGKGKKARGTRLKGLTIIRTALPIPRILGSGTPHKAPHPLAESKKASHNISDQWFRQSFGQPFRFSISGVRDSPQSTLPLPRAKKLPITPQINGFDNHSDSPSDSRILGCGTPHKAPPPCREQKSFL